MPVSELFVFLAAGSAALVAVGLRHAMKTWQSSRDGALRRLAGSQGGRFHEGKGVLAGYASVRRPVGPTLIGHLPTRAGALNDELTVRVDLPRTLPDLRLTPRYGRTRRERSLDGPRVETGDRAFDEAFHTRGHEREAVLQALGPEVRLLCLAQVEAGGRADLVIRVHQRSATDGTSITAARTGWYQRQQDLRAYLDFGCELAETIVRSWDAPWQRVADGWKLDFHAHATGFRKLEGSLFGRPVLIRESTDRRGRITVIRSQAPMPRGLVVAHPEQAERAGWLDQRRKLGNPVLDMAVAAKAHDWEAACSLLADEELTACLLEVVHAYPGSELRHGAVHLVLRGWACQDLEGPLHKVVALAEALRRGMAAP